MEYMLFLQYPTQAYRQVACLNSFIGKFLFPYPIVLCGAGNERCKSPLIRFFVSFNRTRKIIHQVSSSVNIKWEVYSSMESENTRIIVEQLNFSRLESAQQSMMYSVKAHHDEKSEN